jgi:uncharacterized protein
VVYLQIIFGAAFIVWFLELILRRYVAPRIADIFENMPPFDVTEDEARHAAQPISFLTSDGLTLVGSLVRPPSGKARGLVIFFPELDGSHSMSVQYCASVLDAGYALLGFDFRNQGDSGTQDGYAPIHWITEYEMLDVAAVLEFVGSHEELGTLPLITFGVSRGGAAALIAASRYPRIRCAIADSSFSTLSMTRHFVDRFVTLIIPQWLYLVLPEIHVRGALRDALRLSQKRRRCRYVHLENESQGLSDTPVLLISGLRDSYVKPDVARNQQRICGPLSELWLVNDAKHNRARSVATAEYDQRVVSFIRKSLDHASDSNPDDESLPATLPTQGAEQEFADPPRTRQLP